jgi:hypothetical protein
MRKYLLTTLSILALGLAGTAHAKLADGSPYINAQAGVGGIDTTNISDNTEDKEYAKTQEGVAYRLSAGYLFDINKAVKIGPELSYTGYPTNKYGNDDLNFDISGHYYSVGVNTKVFIAKQFYVGGALSAAFVKQQISGEAGSYTDNFDTKKKVLPEARAEVGFDLSKTIDLNLSYSHVFGKKIESIDNITVAPIDTVMFGVGVNF